MSREIKFRVWDKRQSTMCYEPAVPWFITQETLLNDVFHDTNLIYMQYTGLKDKNGKEIYEGDIIKHSYLRGEAIEIVKYYNECAAFGMDSGSGLIELGSASFHYGLEELSYDKSTFEIIGNIHDNPELIP